MMKSHLGLAAVILAVGLSIGGPTAIVTGCTGAQVKAAVPVALELEQIACALAQAELGQTEPKAITLACSIPPSAIDSVVNLLAAQKKGHALAATQKADAGK